MRTISTSSAGCLERRYIRCPDISSLAALLRKTLHRRWVSLAGLSKMSQEQPRGCRSGLGAHGLRSGTFDLRGVPTVEPPRAKFQVFNFIHPDGTKARLLRGVFCWATLGL